jgi:hypothetical protein
MSSGSGLQSDAATTMIPTPMPQPTMYSKSHPPVGGNAPRPPAIPVAEPASR